MSEQRLMIPAWDQMKLVKDGTVNGKKNQLAGAESRASAGAFGQVTISHFKTESFGVWFNNFYLAVEASYLINYNAEHFVLIITLVKDAVLQCEDGPEIKLLPRQFNLLYCPSGIMKMQFTGSHHQNIIFLLSPDLLSQYAKHAPALQSFMETNNNKTADRSSLVPCFLSPDMSTAIAKIIHYKYEPAFAKVYFTSMVNQLLTLMIMRVTRDPSAFSLNSIKPDRAEEVMNLIMQDLELYPTIDELAKKMGMSARTLQRVFKRHFGQPVATFSREVRLEKAHQLLEQTPHPLRVLCTMVGYEDPSNFSVAFKTKYGYTPGEVQRRHNTE